jgi:hypothetical protein
LGRSPYAPILGGDVLRTDVLCRLLVERLASLGKMSEADALEAIEWREPGRGAVCTNFTDDRHAA